MIYCTQMVSTTTQSIIFVDITYKLNNGFITVIAGIFWNFITIFVAIPTFMYKTSIKPLVLYRNLTA